MFTSFTAHARRLLKFNSAWAAPRFGPYTNRSFERQPGGDRLDACMWRYMLAPSAKLTSLLDGVMGARVERSGAGLIAAATTHVRMGDSAFQSAPPRVAAATTGPTHFAQWQWRTEVRNDSTFALRPAKSLQCLMRASGAAADGAAGRRAHRPEETPPPRRCLPCVVVSDSKWVEQCARAVLTAPILTAGTAIHVGASDAGAAHDHANVDKLFLDWWLLARSRVSVDLRAGAGLKSWFFGTALLFRGASSAEGRTFTPTAAALDSPEGLAAACAGGTAA